MKRRSLLIMLLMVLFAPLAMHAQKALPYAYGFENNDLSGEGWTAQKTSSSTGIYNAGSSTAHGGSYVFRFQWSEQDAYLMSPELTGTDGGVDLSFFYAEYSSSYGDEQFYVGYTTDATETDPANFTYGSIVTASTSWQEYTASLPAGTKRIAISYVYNDAFYLYLDDFSFEAPGAAPKPTDLTVTEVNTYDATLAWTENGSATSWQICLNGDEDHPLPANTNPYKLESLTAQTTYTAKVRSVAGTDVSGWSNEVTFTTNDVCPNGMVCIGSGFATNSYLPTYTYYNYSLTQQIYTAAEIGAAGYIQSIAFHSSSSISRGRKLNIYMVSTNKTSFDDVNDWIPVTANDLVFSDSVNFLANDWTTFELDTPFDYDGTSNVAIIVDDNSGYYDSSPSFLAFDATSQAIRIYSDGTNYDPTDPSSYNGTVLNVKNRIRLEVGALPTCPKPSGLTVSNVGKSEATVSWTPGGDERSWEVCLNDDENNLIPVSVTPSTPLSSLTPDTYYTVKVRAVCSADDKSNWTTSQSFHTLEACSAPEFDAIGTSPFSASVSWTGSEDNYDLRYKKLDFNGNVTIILTAHDVWGDGTGYQLLLDADTTAFGTIFAASGAMTSDGVVGSGNYGDVAASVYAEFEYLIPTNADGALTTTNIVEDGSISITIPAGYYDFCITNPTPNDRMWLAADTGPFNPRQDNYPFYAGLTYEITMGLFPGSDGYSHDGAELTITTTSTQGWTTRPSVTSPYNIEGLDPESAYIVQVESNCGSQYGTSDWITEFFETPSNCAAPSQLAANDIDYTSASLSWTGYQTSYNLQYRTAGYTETAYFNDFNSAIDEEGYVVEEEMEGWTYDNLFIYGLDDPIYDIDGDDNYFMVLGWNDTVSSSNEGVNYCILEMPEYESGYTVDFYYFGYGNENTFQVGFSSTDSDVSSFTWGNDVTVNPADGYTHYSEVIPDGSTYVAIKATIPGKTYSIFIDDFGIYGATITAGEWVSKPNVTNPYTLTGLTEGTYYEFQVQGINTNCTGGTTDWSVSGYFTTASACDNAPADLEADPAATSATLTWSGDPESYTLRYRTAVDYDEVFYDDFEEFNGWTLQDTVDGTGYNNEDYGFGLFEFWTYEQEDPQYLISPELEGVGENSLLAFSYYPLYASSYYYSETFQVGFSSTDINVESFTWEDEFNTGLSGGNYTTNVPSGTKYFAIKTIGSDGAGLALWDFIVVTNYTDAGEWITVPEEVTSPYELTGLDPLTWYEWQVKGADCDKWSAKDEFQTLEAPAGQTLQLAAGTNGAAGSNWISFYTQTDMATLRAALVEAMPNTATKIQSQDNNCSYNPRTHRWTGTLTTLDLSQMYKVEVLTDAEIVLDGDPIDPTQVPATLNTGSNWIAFPLADQMTLTDAFAGFAINGDKVQSQGNNANYNRNRWQGQLTTLEPGKGYVYVNGQTNVRTLVFPSASKSIKNNGKRTTLNATKLFNTNSTLKGEKNNAKKNVAVEKLQNVKSNNCKTK